MWRTCWERSTTAPDTWCGLRMSILTTRCCRRFRNSSTFIFLKIWRTRSAASGRWWPLIAREARRESGPDVAWDRTICAGGFAAGRAGGAAAACAAEPAGDGGGGQRVFNRDQRERARDALHYGAGAGAEARRATGREDVVPGRIALQRRPLRGDGDRERRGGERNPGCGAGEQARGFEL